jgi:hypothetical protein
LIDSIRNAIGDTGDDAAGVAMPGQDDVIEIVPLNGVDNVVDMRLEIDLRSREMNALAEPGERDGEDVMSVGAQPPRHIAPRPSAKPRARNQYVSCHQRSINRWRLERKTHGHPRAAALGTGHLDRSPVPLHDLLGASQPDPCAGDLANIAAAPVALEDL